MILLSPKIFIRSCIVLFWLVIFFLFLFLPRGVRFLQREKSITIFTFPLLIDAQYLAQFERETGIKVHIHYYENNDALLAKLRSSEQHGYDIVFPSDYAVEILVKEGLLKKIDKSRLPFWSQLQPKLKHQYFDPDNFFSIPYLWEVYGIGFDKEYFGDEVPDASWRLLFDERISPPHIGMVNNAREAVAIAAIYLFGTTDNIDRKRLNKIKQLLLEQKKRVEMYTDLRADYLLLSKTCSVVACPANEIWQQDNLRLGFLVPREGSFVSIDSVCLPKASKKDDLVYQLINYIYKPETMKYHVNRYAFFPALINIPVRKRGEALMLRTLAAFDVFHFFSNVVPEQQLNKLWIELKSK